jgi:hypothetical protein
VKTECIAYGATRSLTGADGRAGAEGSGALSTRPCRGIRTLRKISTISARLQAIAPSLKALSRSKPVMS